ncbi:hypothetical protein N7486_000537 [Penicillium sp. IBT 16267x]|nr:hypothetical protein N7486_000537 [Penicillium sp. IBT 16267x]
MGLLLEKGAEFKSKDILVESGAELRSKDKIALARRRFNELRGMATRQSSCPYSIGAQAPDRGTTRLAKRRFPWPHKTGTKRARNNRRMLTPSRRQDMWRSSRM